MTVTFTLNGQEKEFDFLPQETLLDILRKNSLIMQKKGCGKGSCGCCTVLLNDKPVASCKIPAILAKGNDIVTLEYFKKSSEYADIMKGFKKAGIELCGYCNAGKIFTTYQIITSPHLYSKEEVTNQLKNLAPCCTDLDTLVNGVLYTLAYRKKNSKNNN